MDTEYFDKYKRIQHPKGKLFSLRITLYNILSTLNNVCKYREIVFISEYSQES